MLTWLRSLVGRCVRGLWRPTRNLAAAVIEEVDVRGRRAVLHSLCHSLATMLAASQVPMTWPSGVQAIEQQVSGQAGVHSRGMA